MQVKFVLAAVVIVILVILYLMQRSPSSEVQYSEESDSMEEMPVEMSEDPNYSGFKSKRQQSSSGLGGFLQGLFKPAKPTVVAPSRPTIAVSPRPAAISNHQVIQTVQTPNMYRVSPPPSISSLPGNRGSKVLNMQCPNQERGNFIKEIRVSDGKYVDAIQINCADGTVMKQGGSGGQARDTHKTNTGYYKIDIGYGDWVDTMQLHPIDSSIWADQYGTTSTFDLFALPKDFFGIGQKKGANLYCPNRDDRISGLVGTYGDYINQLGVGCVSQNPV